LFLQGLLRLASQEDPDSDSLVSYDNDEEEDDGNALTAEERQRKLEIRRRRFDLKRLVRLLHVDRPAQHVLAILGKK